MKDFSKKELAWIKRLQKCLDAQPDSIIGFCTGSVINFAKGNELPSESNKPEGHVSGSYDWERVTSKNWEAGAF